MWKVRGQKDKEPVEKPNNKLSYVGKESEQHDVIDLQRKFQ